MATDTAPRRPSTETFEHEVVDSELPAPRSRRRWLTFLIAGIVVLAGAVWAGRKWIYSRSHASTDNAQVDGHIVVVSPKVQAFVDRVLVDNNERVKAGDTLVVLDDRDLKVRVQEAEAELASTRAAAGTAQQTGQATAQVATTRAQAASARASVASAEANFKRAASDLERIRGLAAKQIVAAQQLDAAQAAYDAAAAELDAARKQAAAAGSQVSASTAALSGATARLEAAQAALDNARLQLSYAYILSPTDGVVANRSVEPGGLVQVGQALMSIVPLRDVWVTANLKETQLPGVSVGDKATFTVDAYPGRTFLGHVESLSPATGARFALLPPDNATGNFTKVVQRVPVRIAVDGSIDPARPLRPGMSVEATITTR
ncbi:MAG TPA: HlyD family secretion protein [Gemmatimonadales bacterium]|nr:HlyD family secretion protein [Gemmatimonadales bacterium]